MHGSRSLMSSDADMNNKTEKLLSNVLVGIASSLSVVSVQYKALFDPSALLYHSRMVGGHDSTLFGGESAHNVTKSSF